MPDHVDPSGKINPPSELGYTGAELDNALLCEVAWEVCQQVGGIYTVIRSKTPCMVKAWGNRYCLVGPYNPQASPAEFEESTPAGPIGNAVKLLQKAGFEVHYGHWLITGRPRVVLLNPKSVYYRLHEIKYLLWEHHGISFPSYDPLVDEIVAFGFLVNEFFRALVSQRDSNQPIIGHFHEWMAGTAIPELRRDKMPVSIVFTTHATLLGRYLAMNDPWFYDHVPFINWHADAKRFNVEAQVLIERAAAHGAHVLTTVSEITGYECKHLLGRKPDVLTPNGLNIERFVALHEFQNLHRIYKAKINEFVMGHFFPSYSFDLDKTLYFFISGRYEYGNKGFNLAIESLARLNWRMKQMRLNRTVVFFIVTKRPFRSINPEVLRTRALMAELRENCRSIQNQVGERLFVSAAMGQWPRLDDLVDDYWRLRLRRNLHAWKTNRLPTIVTHDLVDDAKDEVLNQLRTCNLFNRPEDPVKVVYHPDFITSSDPLFGMDYDHFIRGCHMGIFPSYYEPWGYAPLEAIVMGIPAITSDTSGFGTYVLEHMPDHKEHGIVVLKRRNATFDTSANELTDEMLGFVQMERRDRIAMRNRTESSSEQFDWQNLSQYYRQAHEMGLQRTI
ncbi:MAG: glycosyltransferase [Kiritimatiellae bacterium]|nr:glycosyltransferase [Kiritimatiellia bacterium]MDD5521501.1 glycosyltransferase [Kiritimatiellia bacterium]